MYPGLQRCLVVISGILLCGALPATAQDFNQLVAKSTQDWDKGACKEAQRGLLQALKITSEQVGVAPVADQIRAALLLGDTYLCSGEFDAAAGMAAKLLPLADNNSVRAQAQRLAAESAKGKGQYAEAESTYAEAMRLAADGIPDTDPRRGGYIAAWGDLARLRGLYSQAEARLKDAFAQLDKAGAGNSIERAWAAVAAGDLARDRDAWEEGRLRYKEALAIAQQRSPLHPAAARAWLGIARIELAAGNPDAAEADLKHAREASRDLPASATYLETLDATGMVEISRRNFKDAETALGESLAKRREKRGEQNPITAAGLDTMGLLYSTEQRWDDAVKLLTSAESVQRQTLGPDHPALALTLDHLGRVYRIRRRFDSAGTALDQALNIQKAKLGDESLAVAGTLSEQGNLLVDQERFADAERRFQQALKIEEKLGTPDAPLRAATLRGLALALHGQGRDAEAAPMLAQWVSQRGGGLALTDADRLPVAVAAAEIKLRGNRYSDAEKEFGEILTALQGAKEMPDTVPLIQKELAEAQFGQKKWKEAAANYEASLPRLTERAGTSKAWQNLGACYTAQSQWADGIRAYQKALDAAKKTNAAADTARIALILADISPEAGRADQISVYLDQWSSARRNGAGALSSEEARILEKSAVQLSLAKQYSRAESVLRLLLDSSDLSASQGINVNRVLVELAEVSAAQNKSAQAADYYQRLASRSRAMRRADESEQYLLKARALREKPGAAQGTALVSMLQDLGETYLLEGKYPEAKSVFEQARTSLVEGGAAEDPRVAVSLNGLGAVAQSGRNYEDAGRLYDQAYALLAKLPNPPPRIMAAVLYNIGSLDLANGKIGEASDHFSQCLKLSEGNYTADNPPPLEQFDQIAGAYERQQRFDEAEKRYQANLELRRKLFGENSTEAARGLYSLAVFYNGRKEYDKAVSAGEQALQDFEGREGEESDEVALLLGLLATVYKSKGDIDRAIAATEQSATIQEKLNRPRSEITPTLSALGEFYRDRKNYTKALQVYQRMARLWEADSFAAPTYQTAVLNLANTYVRLNDLQHGREWYTKLQKALQHDPIQLSKAAKSYADALRSSGQDREARKILQQAGVDSGR